MKRNEFVNILIRYFRVKMQCFGGDLILLLICSTMWVGCQSRRFICLFWRETRQRILGPEISPYPEVGRGREREGWRGTRKRSSWRWTAERRAAESWRGTTDRGSQHRIPGQRGSWRREGSWRRNSGELAWNHGQGQSTPDSGDSSREDRVQRQWVKMSLIPVALWNFR